MPILENYLHSAGIKRKFQVDVYKVTFSHFQQFETVAKKLHFFQKGTVVTSINIKMKSLYKSHQPAAVKITFKDFRYVFHTSLLELFSYS